MGFGVAFVVVTLYAILVQNAVLWAILLGLLVGLGYALWRLLVAVEAIADGVHRLADGSDDR
ncbi:hypothetical protein C475_00972 [Halosimplex carlsbadense 2-9-1]|uniref:Uncharacterized protein n=1 Tax=Halosimplex carlsbadense 2-9-1 TaxID=797114 RepID=M0D5X3_9EURY|nr:hypothetical protein C475_00972 [Halosimplex carlsbadense 2-9-1]